MFNWKVHKVFAVLENTDTQKAERSDSVVNPQKRQNPHQMGQEKEMEIRTADQEW